MSRTRDLGSISTRLRRIAELSRVDPTRSLVSLHHYIDVHWLHAAYARVRKDASAGVDGVTAEEYEQDLQGNLEDLLERFKSGSYRAPPVRRVWIPKGDGGRRPIGIPTLEDRVLQRAVAMVLEAVYEEDFLECSFGYRSGRSAHDALQTLQQALYDHGGGWVLEVDLEDFFGSIDHGHLRSMLDERIRDGVIRRVIDKWLKAGVLEDGSVHRSARGTPQGGVISPILANLYLHVVLDRWFAAEVEPRLRGASQLVRFADDFVIAFSNESDARRVVEVIGKRLGRFGLTMHPVKSRLVCFRRPPRGGGGKSGDWESFDFLGFTHYWGKSRRGHWVVYRKTMKSRMSRVLRACNTWCRRHRHRPVWWQWARLSRSLRGFYEYYGITGNYRSLRYLHRAVEQVWYKWLARRSQRPLSRIRYRRILQRYPLPPPRITHQYSS